MQRRRTASRSRLDTVHNQPASSQVLDRIRTHQTPFELLDALAELLPLIRRHQVGHSLLVTCDDNRSFAGLAQDRGGISVKVETGHHEQTVIAEAVFFLLASRFLYYSGWSL